MKTLGSLTAIPRSPLSQPLAVTTFSVRAGGASSWPWRMIRTRPGRSVSQIEPSSANASAQGATRPSATVFTVKLSGPGEVRAVAVGLAVVLDPALGLALDPPPRLQPVTATPISRVEMTAARRGTTPMLAGHDFVRKRGSGCALLVINHPFTARR